MFPRAWTRYGHVGCKTGLAFLLNWRIAAAAACIAMLSTLNVSAQESYDQNHPEVREMILRGMEFVAGNQSNQVGERALTGLAALKSEKLLSPGPPDHPLIDRAVEVIYDRCTPARLESTQDFRTMYASSLACVFLLELDSAGHKDRIRLLLDHIHARQQITGAWGYRDEPGVGDTSQMQYVALALWLAKEKGFDVDTETAARALQWIADTQTAEGGWIYKQPVPTGLGPKAREVRHSLVAAGLGSVWLFADLLRLVPRTGSEGSQSFAELPASVVEVTNENVEESQGARQPIIRFDRELLTRSINQAVRWFQREFEVQVDQYNLYYLYGFERLASIGQLLEGDSRMPPRWYDRGVTYLKSIQRSDGAFVSASPGSISASVQTCFGILFLTRSMSMTVGSELTSRVNAGPPFRKGTFLKDNGETISQIWAADSVSALLEVMNNPKMREAEIRSLVESFQSREHLTSSQQLALSRDLVTHRNFWARLVAVRLLARQRTLENVPALVFALSDPDIRVVREADLGLRFVSRSTEPSPLAGKPDLAEIRKLQEHWKTWYFRVKPDGQLMQGS